MRCCAASDASRCADRATSRRVRVSGAARRRCVLLLAAALTCAREPRPPSSPRRARRQAYRLNPVHARYGGMQDVVDEIVQLLTEPKFKGKLVLVLAGYAAGPRGFRYRYRFDLQQHDRGRPARFFTACEGHCRVSLTQ